MLGLQTKKERMLVRAMIIAYLAYMVVRTMVGPLGVAITFHSDNHENSSLIDRYVLFFQIIYFDYSVIGAKSSAIASIISMAKAGVACIPALLAKVFMQLDASLGDENHPPRKLNKSGLAAMILCCIALLFSLSGLFLIHQFGIPILDLRESGILLKSSESMFTILLIYISILQGHKIRKGPP